MDIEPPEKAIDSWRDFFVHMATIVLGILVAISLEQSVEALHHRYLRSNLEREMLSEAEVNRTIISDDMNNDNTSLIFIDNLFSAMSKAKYSGRGRWEFTVPGPPDSESTMPSRAVWKMALAAGLVAYIPEGRAEVYERLDMEAAQEETSSELAGAAWSDLDSFARRIGVNISPGSTISLTSQQLDELGRLYARDSSAISTNLYRLRILKGANEAVIENTDNLDDMMHLIEKNE